MREDLGDVIEHYGQVEEEARLAEGIGELERIRTEDVLKRHLAPPPGSILDVGGAAGVYAGPLVEAGYEVDLVDPVLRHVELARARFESIGGGRAHVGDARRLGFPDGSRDAVLLLGPLYHLPERADRMRSLREAWRVLRPDGFLLAAAISRYASLLAGFSMRLVRDDEFVGIMERDLADGRHYNPTSNPLYFTTAYMHRPGELRSEVEAAGFEVEGLIGVEGPFWTMPDFADHWNDRATRALMLRVLDRIEAEESLLGVSAHVLAAARKPGRGRAAGRA